MAAKTLPDQLYLCQCFYYNPKTGSLIWKQRPRYHFATERGWISANTRWAGKEAGSINPRSGYTAISPNGIRYYKQRIIWKMMTGNDPSDEVDHENRIPGDYTWNNLRESTRVQNLANSTAGGTNRFGLRGVRQTRPENKFNAHIKLDKKPVYLGTFDTAEEAHAAYCKAAQDFHGDFWKLS